MADRIGKKKVTKLGSPRNVAIKDCPFLVLSHCVVLQRTEEEPVDSNIQQGETLNEALYRLQKENIYLRKRIGAVDGEVKNLKTQINGLKELINNIKN